MSLRGRELHYSLYLCIELKFLSALGVGSKVLLDRELFLWKEVRACPVVYTACSRWLCSRPTTGHSRALQPNWRHFCKNSLKTRKYWWGRHQRREWWSRRRNEQKIMINNKENITVRGEGGAPWQATEGTEGTEVCWESTLEHRKSIKRQELQKETAASVTTFPLAVHCPPEGTQCNWSGDKGWGGQSEADFAPGKEQG